MNPFAQFEDQFGHLQLSDNDAALHVFLAGWNGAMMEMMQRVNKMPFGDDTRASFAVYFQSQMVNVDAIEKSAQQEPLAWYEGPPPFPQDQEWFIAETIYGDRVVLRSLDEGREHKGNYAFTTADSTYMKAENVRRWMQFPDCHYIPPAQQEPVACRYGDNGYACCEGGPCAAEEHNNKTEWQERGMVAEAALAKLLDEKQEPVAVVSGYYGGQCVILPIDPARIYNSNTPLYTAPQPCPTCEALARTVMLDQTSHDAQHTWVGLTEEEHTQIAIDCGCMSADWVFYGAAVERNLKEKNT